MHASKPPLENDAVKWTLRPENTGDGGVIPGGSLMWVGVPREVKGGEKRVGLLPQEVRAIVGEGQDVQVETRAGLTVGFDDEAYRAAGAIAVPAPKAWDGELVIVGMEMQRA